MVGLPETPDRPAPPDAGVDRQGGPVAASARGPASEPRCPRHLEAGVCGDPPAPVPLRPSPDPARRGATVPASVAELAE